MTPIILAALLVALTRNDGQPVHIAPGMVVEITTPFAGLCSQGAKTFVRTLSSTYCVREHIDDVRDKLEAGSREDKLLSPTLDRPKQ